MGEIDGIPQISQISPALPSVQRTGDGGARKQHQQEEEKPPKHDEVELTHQVEPEELAETVAHKEDPPPSSLDLAI